MTESTKPVKHSNFYGYVKWQPRAGNYVLTKKFGWSREDIAVHYEPKLYKSEKRARRIGERYYHKMNLIYEPQDHYRDEEGRPNKRFLHKL